MAFHKTLQKVQNHCILGTIKYLFVEIHNKIRYLVLVDEWCDKVCGRIKYLISKKVVLQTVLIIIILQ